MTRAQIVFQIKMLRNKILGHINIGDTNWILRGWLKSFIKRLTIEIKLKAKLEKIWYNIIANI